MFAFSSISMDWSVSTAALWVVLSIIWTLFLMIDANRRIEPISTLASLGLICHAIPSAFFLGTTVIAQQANDSILVWFVALVAFRYWRIIVNIFFWFKYKPALAGDDLKVSPADCTIIIPTVGPRGNLVYDEMITAILYNRPARIIFSTNTESAAKEVEAYMPGLLDDIKTGKSTYQLQYNLGSFIPTTEILVINASISNKRQQVVYGFQKVQTSILVMVDDTAIWHPNFMKASLPAFGNPKVGFVGTRKWVKRFPHTHNTEVGFFTNLWSKYQAGFWNAMGGLYLVRHNFEIRATNAADGGVFCVSGRSSFIRTSIVNHAKFADAFTNEFILRFGDHFPGWGPVTADDDNFITRWVINQGWNVKIQSSKEATMTTVLGRYPLKFPAQAFRWSRSTFRQNPIALAVDRTVWWKWPLTVHTTLFPWMYNAALFWDPIMVYTLTCTGLFANSSHPTLLVCVLVGFIWISKLVKTIPWFWEYPVDFLLYFVIPAYPLFAYWHSLLKVYTAFTFWDLAWSGRKLK
ncbi:glycosyltransferase family 2 protein [Plenodomus tracheiphilus IPT5]|uniref:Glycosyltransferase family 2 protein n=1 Tax=Plenodomus tracheiphilus IPT5 TaxID=1408161 RepID=A0A6A7BQ74_9PLEO|nr:glycosyltransferase family 2 protein [Plenodomus tracheiphilus IPT5]